MRTNATPPKKRRHQKGGKILPALCHVLGTLILLAVILTYLPLSLPRLFGYEIYNVISGSMEPAIPVGSVVYVKAQEPETILPGDVIAFSTDGTVVTHRVVENHSAVGEFITKGDANETVDMNPVPYGAVIGQVRRHFPVLGQLMMLLSSNIGKAYFLCLAACGVMFHVLAGRIREHRRQRALEAELASHWEDVPAARAESESAVRETPERKKRKKRTRIRRVLMVLLAVIFLASAGTILVVRRQYRLSRELYEGAAAQFTAQTAAGNWTSRPGGNGESEEGKEDAADLPPISVDFEALHAVNPDVIGWIYCPDTIINYPILHGYTNDTYLYVSYNKEPSNSGSIFAEAGNQPDFSDFNTILYGHHMQDGSMFASLEEWIKQDYFDEHPVMWLLTPERDYKLILFSAYTTSAFSDTYTIFQEPGEALNNYLRMAVGQSAVQEDITLYSEAHYVVMSTCAYVFDYARSVVHGMMVPVDSAGGKPLE
ncbi:MAG: class B sortase [Oscillospiraceae bacterium]|nr:class B sortase [Oscillospiraceae bacterium]